MVIHGAGQTNSSSYRTMGKQAFKNYSNVMGPNRLPLVYMYYVTFLDNTAKSANDVGAALRALKADIQEVHALGHWVIPQIGLSFPPAGVDASYDAVLSELAAGIKDLDRPVYLRIGYEFNGNWYSPMYQPASFISSFRYITQYLRDRRAPVATLWNSYPGYTSGTYGQFSYIDDFYPGDDYVDWVSYDTFSQNEANFEVNTALRNLLDFAAAHGKPVMIGEATPRYQDVKQSSSLGWFQQFFTTINKRAEVKGHTYINWDWSLTTQWPDWGDARLEVAHPTVLNGYLGDISKGNPVYAHAGPISPFWVANPRAAVVWQWEANDAPSNETAMSTYISSMVPPTGPRWGQAGFTSGRFGRAVAFDVEGRYDIQALDLPSYSTNAVAFWFRPTVPPASGVHVLWSHPHALVVEGSSRFAELVLDTNMGRLELRVRRDTSPAGTQSDFETLSVALADIDFRYDEWNLLYFKYRSRTASATMGLGGNGRTMSTLSGLSLQAFSTSAPASGLIRFGRAGQFDSMIVVSDYPYLPDDYFCQYWSIPRPFEPYASVLYPSDRDGDGLPDSFENARGLNPNRRDATGDADSNGWADLFDFTLGAPTGGAPPAGAIQFGLGDAYGGGGGDYLTIEVNRDPQSSGVALRAKVSPDVVNWAGGPQNVTVLENSASRFRARDNTPVNGADRRFIRVEAVPATQVEP